MRSLSIMVIILSILIIVSVVIVKLQLDNVKDIQLKQQEEHVRTNQFLLSTIDWSTKRQKLILFIRDVIVEDRQKSKKLLPIPLEDAYLIAETDVTESEKYPNLDALLLLAMQRCESRFDKTAVSSEGAMGVNQLMPSTGRLLCTHFNIEYRDSLLYNIVISTKFAAKLLDVLYTTYQNYDLMLADYNGGPYAASYYKHKQAALPQETAEYVPCVLKTWESYKDAMQLYNINLESNMKLINFDSTSRIDMTTSIIKELK